MAKLTKTKAPGIFRRHVKGCHGEGRCKCSYVIVWRHRGRQHTETYRTFVEASEAQGGRKVGETQPSSRKTVRAYYQDWIDSYRGRTRRGLEDTTRREYRTSFERHVLPQIGGLRLGDLSAKGIREWMEGLESAGRSPNTIRKARVALSAMLASAVEDDDLTANPTIGVRYIPSAAAQQRHRRPKRRELNAGDVGMILAAMSERWRVFFAMLTQTGVRIGELLGLTWGNVDLGDEPSIQVAEQIYEGKRKRLKTEASQGRVPLSHSMARELQRLRPEGVADDAPVFASESGAPLRYHNVLRGVLRPALRDSGMAIPLERDEDGKVTKWDYQGIAFHAFRKACGSILFASGKNPKQVQGWLRHSRLTTTMDIYVHDVDDGLGDAGIWDEVDWVNTGSTEGLQTPANPDRAESAETVH